MFALGFYGTPGANFFVFLLVFSHFRFYFIRVSLLNHGAMSCPCSAYGAYALLC